MLPHNILASLQLENGRGGCRVLAVWEESMLGGAVAGRQAPDRPKVLGPIFDNTNGTDADSDTVLGG